MYKVKVTISLIEKLVIIFTAAILMMLIGAGFPSSTMLMVVMISIAVLIALQTLVILKDKG